VIAYIIRRILYAIPIVIGVNLITFMLFFMVNSPDDMARMHLGNKHVSQAAIQQWKAVRGYDLPAFYNPEQSGIYALTDTLFVKKSMALFYFDFGVSDQGRDISHDIAERMWPSLALAVPTLLVGMTVNIIFALFMVMFRGRFLDYWGVVFCVTLMSISSLFYIILGQLLFAKWLRWVPVSGYQEGWDAIRFLVLPVAVGVLVGLGSGARWYRSIVLEESAKPYVQAARAKGLSQWQVLFRHVLKNAMIPILTGVVVIIPSLFMGSLIMESFFGIPGLGSYTIDAIAGQDFEVVRVMVFLGTLLYILGLILTDLSYAWVDPRVKYD
jgi:peptide/nickel transport system permease protein